MNADIITVYIQGTDRAKVTFRWAAVVVSAEGKTELTGGQFGGTLPATLITGLIEVLEGLGSGRRVRVVSNNDYLVTEVVNKLPRLHSSGYRKSDGKPVANLDLIKELYQSSCRFSELTGVHARMGCSPEQLRAAELASQWGEGEVVRCTIATSAVSSKPSRSIGPSVGRDLPQQSNHDLPWDP